MHIFDTHLGFRKLLLEKNKISQQKQEQKKRPKQHTPACFFFCTLACALQFRIFLRISFLQKVE